ADVDRQTKKKTASTVLKITVPQTAMQQMTHSTKLTLKVPEMLQPRQILKKNSDERLLGVAVGDIRVMPKGSTSAR
ncbi:MAG: hypothetical protein AAF653_12915, partial [Chloroflexota bacterium]